MEKEILKALTSLQALVKGSLGWTRMKCGNPRCKCARGELHTACYLSYRKEGKTHTIHVPKSLAGKVEKYCENWKSLKALLERQTEQVLTDLLKGYRTSQKIKRKRGVVLDGKSKRPKGLGKQPGRRVSK